jgi:hypothetical protein
MVETYRQRMGLGGVAIKLRIVPPDVLEDDHEDPCVIGDCSHAPQFANALIRLLDPALDKHPKNRSEYDPEQAAVHEMSHLLLKPLVRLWDEVVQQLGVQASAALSSLWQQDVERVCNQITSAVLDRRQEFPE